MSTKPISLNDWCFGCGRLNPCGLKLEFSELDGDYVTHFTGRPEHQGYDGIMHGGIISTLLDEIMARYIYCLLYTSPSPRDRQKSRMPSSA